MQPGIFRSVSHSEVRPPPTAGGQIELSCYSFPLFMQLIIPDQIQFIMSAPHLVILVLASYIIKRSIHMVHYMEMYLTTGCHATKPNFVPVCNTLSFPSMCTQPIHLIRYSLYHLYPQNIFSACCGRMRGHHRFYLLQRLLHLNAEYAEQRDT